MTVTRTSGPPTSGGKDRTGNPGLPKSLEDGALEEMLPGLAVWLAGGVVGVIEALGKSGMLPIWAELDSHWKALIFGICGIAAGWQVGELKAQRADTRGKDAQAELEANIERFIEARGLCWGLALIHGVEAGARFVPIDGFERLGQGGLFVTKEQALAAGLQVGGLDQLIDDDVRPAIDELLRNRAAIEREREAMRPSPVGELAIGELAIGGAPRFRRG